MGGWSGNAQGQFKVGGETVDIGRARQRKSRNQGNDHHDRQHAETKIDARVVILVVSVSVEDAEADRKHERRQDERQRLFASRRESRTPSTKVGCSECAMPGRAANAANDSLRHCRQPAEASSC